MKILILLLTICSVAFSDQYVFLVNKYDKEIEYEAKIILKIATSSLAKEIKLFIPDISQQERKIYSEYFNLTKNCETANFIFDNKGSLNNDCKTKNKLFFTNNYKKLMANEKYYGAFFWSKSRPNIVFIKNRLEENNIILPDSYLQFVEDM